MTKKIAPVLKWVGGKRQLLNDIKALLPENIAFYCEPFLGGGALLFELRPRQAVVNDINRDLIDVYECVKDEPRKLIEALKKHRNDAEHFYRIRELDRDPQRYEAMTRVDKAARFIFLNKTCYNGLYRVNASGAFNTPFGRYKNPNIVNEENILAVHEYLCQNDIVFYGEDFASTLNRIPDNEENAFVYLDPPYDPISATSNFTAYAKDGFGREEQLRLKQCCDALTRRNIRFLLSNAATPFIKEIYADYRIRIVPAKRAINADGTKRSAVDEVLIRNYE